MINGIYSQAGCCFGKKLAVIDIQDLLRPDPDKIEREPVNPFIGLANVNKTG
jgi:hypothetical protein